MDSRMTSSSPLACELIEVEKCLLCYENAPNYTFQCCHVDKSSMKICYDCIDTLVVQKLTKMTADEENTYNYTVIMNCPFCRNPHNTVMDNYGTLFLYEELVDMNRIHKTALFINNQYQEKIGSLERQLQMALRGLATEIRSNRQAREDLRRQVLLPFAEFLNIPITRQ